MTTEDYGLSYRLASSGEKVEMEIDIRNRFSKGPVPCWNVVGEIAGSEKPDEIVVCGGHLDSWDLGTGATDNGTGSIATLEVARVLKALNIIPKRTIRFILFGGEEEGLVGSRAYVEAHKAELPRVSGAFVLDTGAGRIKAVGLDGNTQDQATLEQAFADLKPMGLAEYWPFPMKGTDHASFTDVGVPGFWFGQESKEYGLTHHSQSDTYDKVEDANLRQAVAVMASAVVRVADLPALLPRKTK
jgi:carboxypeptidase Q